MNLRDQAATDLQNILGDVTAGFGRNVTVTDPSGATAVIVGFTNDISTAIDPETGTIVTSRTASVVLPIAALVAAGFELPRSISDKNSKPWRVSFADVPGNTYAFKVSEARPDRALGCVVCMLEAYKS